MCVCLCRDYNNYFDAIPVRQISGAQNAEFVKFSSQALKAAKRELAAFIKLLPASEVEQAASTMVYSE